MELLGVLGPDSGPSVLLLLRLPVEGGAGGAGRLGLILFGEGAGLVELSNTAIRSVKLPLWDRRELREVVCTSLTVGGSTNEADTGLPWDGPKCLRSLTINSFP